MEEEISYSTVVFKNRDEPPKEKKPEEPPVYSEVKLKGTAATVPEKNPEEPPVYSEVTPKGTAATVPEKKPEEPPVHSEVTPKGTAATVPEKNPEEPPVHSEVTPKGTATTVPEADSKEEAHPRLCALAVCLGILCVFLVGTITAVIYMSVIVDKQEAKLSNITAENQQLIVARSILQTKTDELSMIVDEQKANLTNLTAENQQLIVARSILQTETDKLSVIVDEQKANLTNLTAENQQLIVARSILQTETDKLSRINDKFNWTLNTILNFDNFPVNEYCPEKKCQPCRNDWILFQEKCYLIDLRDSPWLSWNDSRKQCQNFNADLVVIDSLEEQELISKRIQSYFDKFHGYWMGLYKDPNESSNDQKWLWINGRNDTLKYLLQEQNIGTPGPCVMVIPQKNPSASWDTADCIMQNRFICEMDPVIWPN